MEDIVRYIRRKKYLKVFECLFIFIFSSFILYTNINMYKGIINNKFNKITSLKQINKDNRFVSIDATKLKEENYSIIINDKKNNIYTLNIDENNILIILKENTLLTNKVNVEVINENDYTKKIKEKYKDNNYYKVVLSNYEYNENLMIQKIKLYIILVLIIVSIISFIISLVGIIKPNSTKMYKIYVKKYTKTL